MRIKSTTPFCNNVTWLFVNGKLKRFSHVPQKPCRKAILLVGKNQEPYWYTPPKDECTSHTLSPKKVAKRIAKGRRRIQARSSEDDDHVFAVPLPRAAKFDENAVAVVENEVPSSGDENAVTVVENEVLSSGDMSPASAEFLDKVVRNAVTAVKDVTELENGARFFEEELSQDSAKFLADM